MQQLAISYYDGIYVGFATLFRISQYVVDPAGRHIDEGAQIDHTELITSRDGVRFDRVAERQSFLEPAPSGFGATGYRLAPHVLVHGDEVRIYVSSNRSRTGRWKGLEIGLATLEKDRFVALQPERMREPALVELTPMVYDRLPQLNATIGKAGRVRAELADMNGIPLNGFTRDDAVALETDARNHPLRWQADGQDYDLARLSKKECQQPLRLRLWFEQSQIHALRQTEVT